MGLFSSTKIPQPPLPNLAIHLYNAANKIYRPDDVVRGHVVLKPLASIEPSALHVSVFGNSLVWHRMYTGGDEKRYYHWRDNAPLFDITQDILHVAKLYTGEEEKEKQEVTPPFEPGQTYKFPFEFIFPTRTSNTRKGQYSNDTDPEFEIGPHDLPPSFCLGWRLRVRRGGWEVWRVWVFKGYLERSKTASIVNAVHANVGDAKPGVSCSNAKANFKCELGKAGR